MSGIVFPGHIEMIGRPLGPYRILDKLGEGGMGEVYAAEDARLKRHVAIKVLPATVANDPVRLARFEISRTTSTCPRMAVS